MFAIKFQWKNEYIKNFWVPGILPAINATVSCCLYHTFDTVHRYQSSLCCFKIQHLITGYKQMLRGSLGYPISLIVAKTAPPCLSRDPGNHPEA